MFTVKVHDASQERKTTENFLRIMRDVINTVEQEWGGKVVAVVTDASGESRKMRHELVKERPSLVVPDCFAHQV